MSISLNFGNDLAHYVKSRAGWGIVLGILTACLGLLFIAFPVFGAGITTIFVGWLLILAGVFDVVQALRVHTVGAFFARLLLGIVYCVGGAVLLSHPLWGMAVLTLALGATLLVEGGVTAVLAFETKPRSGWSWLLFDAAITAILGFLILSHWPASTILAIGTLVGAALVMRGVTRIALSAGVRRVTGKLEEIHPRSRRAA